MDVAWYGGSDSAGKREEGCAVALHTGPPLVRLAGEDLGRHRHVCALVNGPDDAAALLVPFILDGFEQGDRALLIVDPGSRDAEMDRLRTGGVDVSAAMASHQLEVLTWTDAYLRGGRFDRTAQLAFMRRSLAEGPGLGYRVTRGVGNMDWAVDVGTADDLVVYEARLDDLLRGLPDIVICTYDLNRHSARTIAGVLGVHSGAVVGGVLRSSGGPAPMSARDRLIAAASRLFHENGIQATGVDTLIATAGVAKATFYRHFPSKDDLVVAWLQDTRTRWFEGVRAQVEGQHADSSEAIPLLFDAVGEWLEAGNYRGCPYLNVGAEITDAKNPVRLVVREYLQEIEDYLDGMIAAAGYRHSRMLATEVQTLLAGAISLGVARHSGAAMVSARDAAMALLAGAERD